MNSNGGGIQAPDRMIFSVPFQLPEAGNYLNINPTLMVSLTLSLGVHLIALRFIDGQEVDPSLSELQVRGRLFH